MDHIIIWFYFGRLTSLCIFSCFAALWMIMSQKRVHVAQVQVYFFFTFSILNILPVFFFFFFFFAGFLLYMIALSSHKVLNIWIEVSYTKILRRTAILFQLSFNPLISLVLSRCAPRHTCTLAVYNKSTSDPFREGQIDEVHAYCA